MFGQEFIHGKSPQTRKHREYSDFHCQNEASDITLPVIFIPVLHKIHHIRSDHMSDKIIRTGAAYVRVSTDKQEELSPDAQKRLL